MNHTLQKKSLENISKVIIVASGKGGVGKSTVSSLIAMQLSANGKKVGLLDADIYGPSIPTIFNVDDQFPEAIDGKFEPVKSSNISIMSIGFLVKSGAALAWRGPMLSKSLNQILFSTNWGELDYLIIDMPPGTGDIHITIAQRCKIDYVVIVSTPDKISLKDVERAIDLYQKLGLKISGIVQNMSYINSENSKISLFGNDLNHFAKSKKIEIIANLPLIPNLSDDFEKYSLKDLQINFDF
jgi:ATP-binding protein involved in chromosome partitioning